MKLISNPMRFGTSTFNFNHGAFLIAKEPFDARNQTAVEGFTISGAQPTDTDRRIIFKIDNKLYKFDGSNLVTYDGAGEFDDVISNGNTVSELTALTDIPAFVGKQIYPIIALFAHVNCTVMPSIKIALKVRKSTETYTLTKTSPEYALLTNDGTPRITALEKSDTCTGDASADVKIRIKNADTWSDFMKLEDAIEQDADSIQFQYTFNVTEIDGEDSAKINGVTYNFATGAAAVSGSNADLYSIVQNYESDLQTCYLVVKHDPLVDSTIKAYVNFMAAPQRRELITIGTSNGSFQTLPLGVNNVKDIGIDQHSIRLYADAVPLLDFDYNVETSEVTINVANGKVITASYDYGHGSETWLEMDKVIDSQPYFDDTYMSRFHFTLPDSQTENKKISNVRLQLTRPTGKVTNQSLGKATGKVQMLSLPHRATQSTISLNAEWSYEPESQILSFVAAKNTALNLSYSWVGEQPVVHSFTCGWAGAV